MIGNVQSGHPFLFWGLEEKARIAMFSFIFPSFLGCEDCFGEQKGDSHGGRLSLSRKNRRSKESACRVFSAKRPWEAGGSCYLRGGGVRYGSNLDEFTSWPTIFCSFCSPRCDRIGISWLSIVLVERPAKKSVNPKPTMGGLKSTGAFPIAIFKGSQEAPVGGSPSRGL